MLYPLPLKFSNELDQLSCLKHSIINFGDIKMITGSQSTVYSLARQRWKVTWLYTGGNDSSFFSFRRVKVKCHVKMSFHAYNVRALQIINSY
jgi:hypothetical protein